MVESQLPLYHVKDLVLALYQVVFCTFYRENLMVHSRRGAIATKTRFVLLHIFGNLEDLLLRDVHCFVDVKTIQINVLGDVIVLIYLVEDLPSDIPLYSYFLLFVIL